MSREISYDEVKAIIAQHRVWRESSAAEGCCADFSTLTLRDMDLSRVQLNDVTFIGTRFYNVNFNNSILCYANMREATFENCNFENANMCGIQLSGTILNNVSFDRADLSIASFYCADILSANFKDARIEGTIFQSAHVVSAENLYIPMACPSNGGFIGWKKALNDNDMAVIVKLLIPPDAKRSSGCTRKCRASKAEVIAIETLSGTNINQEKAHSWYNEDFEYKVGETLEIEDFDDNRYHQCAPGIHFFIDRQDAVDYIF